ncbi:DNA gyrase inhibitor YacG [Hyphomicrobium sp.]|uniref:DNA gyrase inhibitor YacG n=1 Tax=Hyphomicrobium sp. TaxID=82 RepID=UPI0039C8B050
MRCPICGKDAVEAYRPFCSKRCADIDLAKWLGGTYAIAGREEDEGDDPEAQAPRQRPNGEDEED